MKVLQYFHKDSIESRSLFRVAESQRLVFQFHFMERIVDDPFSVCKGRSGVGSPTPLSKLRTSAMTSPTSSSDSSLSQTAGATTYTTATDSVSSGASANAGGDRSSQDLKG